MCSTQMKQKSHHKPSKQFNNGPDVVAKIWPHTMCACKCLEAKWNYLQQIQCFDCNNLNISS